MEQKNRLWIGIGVVVALALAVGSIIWLRPGTGPSSQTATTTSSAVGTSTSLGNGISVSTNGQGVVSMVNGTPTPSLTRPISFSASLPANAQASLRANEQTLIAQLKQTPRRADLWLQLGVDRKIAGDYQGAIDAWTYVAKTGPSTINYVAYGDIADVYMNFQKNYPKAEANYKAAIAINPHIVGYYVSLYTFYKYLYKTNTTAAADILTQGLKALPNNHDLLVLQQQMQQGQ